MYEIAKEFNFCYGHRVWSQALNKEYALTSQSKCRFLHGHEGKVVVFLRSEQLQGGMVTDFNHLNWLKQFIDENIDHKFIIDQHDPAYKYMVNILNFENDEQLAKEYTESFYIVDFIPTSENLARWMFDLIQEKMQPLGIVVSGIEWWETSKSKSTYTGNT
jgi:6-pyruvoyltetrahydropterin/6-carboxytetrahydropterin synthase